MTDRQQNEKIAVIGMGGLFPGADSLDLFWKNLVDNKDLVSQSTAEDLGAPTDVFFYPEKGKLDKCYSLRGGYIRGFRFDPQGYRLEADILNRQDVQFKWALFAAREALSHSGYWNHAVLRRCGVIVGNLSFPTRYSRQVFAGLYAGIARELLEDLAETDVEVPPSNSRFPADLRQTLLTNAPAALIAQAIGLSGPHYSLDAACASSLYAIKLACDELRLGKADLMIAGAVSGADPLFIFTGFSYFHAYARQHELSAPLDRNSAGLVSAEGAGMIVLKRLADARRDGDRVLAVIDGVGLSNDGRGKFLLSPNPRGQRLAFERAYVQSGINPADIDYLECHATGTPLGDITELNSISDFFVGTGHEAPLMGSVKSNLGHLLTAAGMAGLIKVIMAMHHRYLPATIKIGEPLSSNDGKLGPGQIVRQNRPWEAKGPVAHAGVNAFGFGGTNAHLILSADQQEANSGQSLSRPSLRPLAITGMDLHFGPCENLEQFYLALVHGRPQFRELPPERWKGMEGLAVSTEMFGLPPANDLRGAWIDAFDLDLLRTKIQPREAERLNQQQTLMLRVALGALRDAGIEANDGKTTNVAVIIAMESELEIHQRVGRSDLLWQVPRALEQAGLILEEGQEAQLTQRLKDALLQGHEDHSPSEHTGFIGNIIASRISSLMDFTGPSFTVSSVENAVFKGLEVAQNLLSLGEVDAVVLGSVDLAGSLERIGSRHVLNPVNDGTWSMGWNRSSRGWNIGEGAGAIVLKRVEEAADDRVYAIIDDLAIVQTGLTGIHGQVDARAVEEAAATVIRRQGLIAGDIGLLEVNASGISSEDQAEIEGLTRIYRSENDGLTCALGSSKAYVGHAFSASGIVSIIKTALSLYYRFLPAVPGWEGPRHAERFAGTPFYVPAYAQPWIPEHGRDRLLAAVNGMASDGTCAHLILSEAHHPDPKRAGSFLLKGGERIFPIRAGSPEEMRSLLEQVEQELEGESFQVLSDRLCGRWTNGPASGNGLTAVLVAASDEGLRRETAFFRRRISAAWEERASLMTPSGSYFTAVPLGAAGRIALVYPGSGSAYTGLGSTLFHLFPGLYDDLKSRVLDMSNAFFSPFLYPRSMEALSDAGKSAREERLLSEALPMMAIGCTFSAAYTSLLQRYLGVPGDAVAGYSMGETSAIWYSLGVWDARLTKEKFIDSPLFREEVGGEMKLLGAHWAMPPQEARSRWTSCLIRQPAGIPGFGSLADWYRLALAPLTRRVYLTFINTDTEIVLSGDKDEIHEILKRYGLQGRDLPLNNIVHHDFCRNQTPEFIRMHQLPLEWPPAQVYYSGVTAAPLDITPDSLALNALEVCCREVDWPRLIRRLADDRYAFFIELGPNANCSRWTDEVLGNRPHMAIPADRKGSSDLRNLTGMVAMLLAHGVPVDIRHFHTGAADGNPWGKVLNKKLRMGGPVMPGMMKGLKEKLIFTMGEQLHPELVEEQASLAGAVPAARSAPLAVSVKSTLTQPQTTSYLSSMVIENQTAAKIAENGLKLQDYNDPGYLKDKTVIWDEQDLLTFATGKISDVFGKDYEIIDTYRRRVMLPMPPYLLVSRVTRLEAKMNEYKPSMLTTEYDIPYGSPFSTDGQITWAVAVESGQCDLLLISYLGIDFQNKGDYVYRLLDCTMTFLDDLPFEGQTLRYDIYIDNYVRNGNNLLFFFRYDCFVGDRMVLKMRGGCAGFFSDEDLATGKGVVYKAKEIEERNNRPKRYFAPLLDCGKTFFSREDLLALTRGDLVSCFGLDYHTQGRNPSLRLPQESILMLDRITKVDLRGGTCGLGLIEAEKDLKPDDWYFPCHFRDDEVLAGSLQAEGGGQLLRFFMLYLGMQRLVKDARFQAVLNLPQKVICRKEIPPRHSKLVYRLDVREIGLTPEPYVVADLEILYEGNVAVLFENLGLRLQEKADPQYLKQTENLQEGIYVRPVGKPVLFDEHQITQFALGPVHRCFGDEYRVFEGRSLSRQPNTDLQFISRVLSVEGQRHTFNNRPVITAEYDVPADAWYYRQNPAPGVMPYSVLMEVALQPCGFLGAYLGSTLAASEQDLFFRNLDGEGTYLREVDLRGRTVTNRACLVSHTRLGGTVLQRYTFELEIDGAPFYRGSASFGFFTHADLSSQAGLDQGKKVKPWLEENPYPKENSLSFKLDSLFGQFKLYRSVNPASPDLHLASDQLNLLDSATIIRQGGRYGKGYIHAQKAIMPYEWFFTCHFYQDPVMPGSLGVEAIFQAVQLLALQLGLGEGKVRASFRHPAPHQTIWKYRGQILRHDPEMNVEAHLRELIHDERGVTLIADASLWKGDLRIYEVTGLAVQIR